VGLPGSLFTGDFKLIGDRVISKSLEMIDYALILGVRGWIFDVV